MTIAWNSCRRLVVKIGSSLMADEADGSVRAAWLATVAEDIATLRREGKAVIVVTSGAVALGRNALSLRRGALTLEEKQAAAACGQIALFSAWADALAPYALPAAQLLLTAGDSENRRRYLNARNTLETLLEHGAVPIINENDTVATQELRVGDNDRLSARVAQMSSADVLVLLSDIDGLYTANPRTDNSAIFIPEVRGGITPEIEAMAGGSGSSVGTGGMVTKLAAARIALSANCHMLIARGDIPHPLRSLSEGGKATWFVASGAPASARKHWIAGSLNPMGALVVDAGAVAALEAGKSLLPVGVTAVEGQFERGDAVLIRDMNGQVLGKGLAAYSSADAARIRGKKTQEIEAILGYQGRQAIIHRDDMALNG